MNEYPIKRGRELDKMFDKIEKSWPKPQPEKFIPQSQKEKENV